MRLVLKEKGQHEKREKMALGTQVNLAESGKGSFYIQRGVNRWRAKGRERHVLQ